MSKKKIITLFIYLTFMLCIGIILSYYILNFRLSCCLNDKPIIFIASLGGIGTALVGSSFFYLRKLYKYAINYKLNVSKSDVEKINELGMCLYYYLRPVFSVALSLLIQVALLSSVQIVTIEGASLNEGYIYLVMLISFFGGFAAGDLITYLESKGNALLRKTLNI